MEQFIAGERSKYQLKFHRFNPHNPEGDNSEDSSIQNNESVSDLLGSYLSHPPSLQQLPPDVDEFTGRHGKFYDAIALLKQANFLGHRSPIVLAISGQAGVGKSTLAIHIAHQMRQTFADVQLYINLRSNDLQPLALADVLASFLRAWDITDAVMPESLEERSRLLHSCLAGKRTLILLDNAENEAQVRSLLPTSGVCAVLITSRKRLTELQGAKLLNLVEMSEVDALDLLQRFVPANVIQAESEIGMSAVNFCSRLPLAICTFGHLLKSQPHLPLRTAVELLAEARKRSKLLHLSYPDIRATFTLSYQRLEPIPAKLLRLLSLLAEPSFSLTLASVLLESSLDAAREAIQPLIALRLIESLATSPEMEGQSQRFRFVHTLIRLLVRRQLASEDSIKDRQAARLRVCQWYLNALNPLNLALEPTVSTEIALLISRRSRLLRGTSEQQVQSSALNWFVEERLSLLTAIEWADQAEDWSLVIALTNSSVKFYDACNCWVDWERTHRLALNAARQWNDRSCQAVILNNLGNLYLRQKQVNKAQEYYKLSLSLLATLPDRLWEAQTWVNLGILHLQQGQLDKAVMLWQVALTKLPETHHKLLLQWMQEVDRSLMQQAYHQGRDRPPSQRLFQSIGGALKRFIFE